MMTFEKVLEVFNDYLNKDSVLEVVNTKRGYTVMIWAAFTSASVSRPLLRRFFKYILQFFG